MRRVASVPRPDWKQKVENSGLVFHTIAGEKYWSEDTYYELTAAEVDVLEAATEQLQSMCLEATQHIIDHNRFVELGIPAIAIPLIKEAWEQEPPAIYGRMDFAYGSDGVPKLLEYNADTPTSLLEASVIQWQWKEDVYPDADQFNSIHEKLQAKWTELREWVGPIVHFTFVTERTDWDKESLEDFMTASYMQEVAASVGISTQLIHISDIGWDGLNFCDLDNLIMETCFKLYPWEWLITEEFGKNVAKSKMQWMEPIWKMLLSNKGLLPVLWELFPHHKNLLPAYFDITQAKSGEFAKGYVRKPLLGREGNNISIYTPDAKLETSGPYDVAKSIVQAYTDLGSYDGYHPVIGSWLVDQASAGIGIRETTSRITDNTARFVPHLFR